MPRRGRPLGRPLTAGQEAAVRGICTDGRRVSLVLGVAGSGKTTAIRCVAEAYAAAGYQVIGTATSGQAARTLGPRSRHRPRAEPWPRCCGASTITPSP